jgi:hypothetical protein
MNPPTQGPTMWKCAADQGYPTSRDVNDGWIRKNSEKIIGREKPKLHRAERVLQWHLFHHFTRKHLKMRYIFDSQKLSTTNLGYDILLYKLSVNEKCL